MDRETLIAEIREQHKMRDDFQKAEQRLTLQAKAICRRICDGDKRDAEALYKAVTQPNKYDHPEASIGMGAITPLLAARDPLTAAKNERGKKMGKLVKELPVWGWAKDVRGIAPVSLAQIIGEAGDLSNYPDKGKLYKRLGVAVIGGERQRRVKDAELAKIHSYKPSRRAIIYVVGENFIRAGGHYYQVYMNRIMREVEKAHEEGLEVVTTQKGTVDSWLKRGLPEPTKVKDHDNDHYRLAGHIHLRAKRYAEKTFLRDLWVAWRDPLGYAVAA